MRPRDIKANRTGAVARGDVASVVRPHETTNRPIPHDLAGVVGRGNAAFVGTYEAADIRIGSIYIDCF